VLVFSMSGTSTPGTKRGNKKSSKGSASGGADESKRAAKKQPPASSEPSPKAWTFLTNHAHVLILLYAEPGLVLREVAQRVGITERAVQRIVQDLEEDGFIRREKVGRKNHYEVLIDKSLRHPIEWHRNIGDLIKLITG
jgi:predicted transcriptional regulator